MPRIPLAKLGAGRRLQPVQPSWRPDGLPALLAPPIAVVNEPMTLAASG